MSVFIVADLDGCVFPNVNSDNRTQHERFGELVEQVEQIRAEGGASCIATGRTINGITADKLFKQEDGTVTFPLDYIICSVGTEIYKLVDGEYVKYEAFDEHLLDAPEGKVPFNIETVKNALEVGDEGTDYEGVHFRNQPPKIIAGLRHSYYADATVNLNAITDEDELSAEIIRQTQLIEDAVRKTLPEDLDYKPLISLEKKGNHIEGFNVDILPSNAGKDNARAWLIEEAKTQGKEYDVAVVWDDTPNGKANMYPEKWTEQGINKVAFIAPANRTPDLHQHLMEIQKQYANDNNVLVYSPKVASDFYSDKGGAGGLVEGLKAMRERFRSSEPTLTIETQSELLGSTLN